MTQAVRAGRPAPVRRGLLALAALASAGLLPAWAQERPEAEPALRFGALPVGGAVQWRQQWGVLLDALGAALQHPVSSASVRSAESLEGALVREHFDIAQLPGRLALDAVLSGRMRVVAQVAADAASAPRALLLTRREDTRPLDRLLAEAGRARLARGDSRSLTGFVVPQVQLLLPRGLEIETAFRDERVGSHQGNALALANGDVDLATNDSMHFDCFARQFPVEHARLRVAWRSTPTPPPLLLVREDWPVALQRRVRDFFVALGQRADAPALREALVALQMPLGFAPADNDALLPVAGLVLDMERQRARAARWVDEQARLRRLARLEQTHAQQVSALRREQ